MVSLIKETIFLDKAIVDLVSAFIVYYKKTVYEPVNINSFFLYI